MSGRHVVAIITAIAVAAGIGRAQTGTACSLAMCGLELRKPHWYSELEVVQGSRKERIASQDFLPASIRPLRNREDEAGRYYGSYRTRRKVGLAMIIVSIPALALTSLGAMVNGDVSEWRPGAKLFAVGSVALFGGGVVLTRNAGGRLRRAITLHNAGLTR